MSVRELSSTPGTLRLLVRSALSLRSGGTQQPGPQLPDVALLLTDVAIDRDHLAAYARVCGFTLRDSLPATYPHVLAFPLAVELMTEPSFPFPAPGLTHVANTIRQDRPLRLSDRLDLRVWTADLRPHRRGQQFDVVAEVSVRGATAWTQTSTYFRRGPGGGEDHTLAVEVPQAEPAAQWHVAADTGRRYAAVSGDRNPIHLYPLTARLFGFPRPITHGMWTKARCLAALEGRYPQSFETDVVFQQPILLPTDVAFAAERRDGGWRFAVLGPGERRHLVGTLARIASAD